MIKITYSNTLYYSKKNINLKIICKSTLFNFLLYNKIFVLLYPLSMFILIYYSFLFLFSLILFFFFYQNFFKIFKLFIYIY